MAGWVVGRRSSKAAGRESRQKQRRRKRKRNSICISLYRAAQRRAVIGLQASPAAVSAGLFSSSSSSSWGWGTSTCTGSGSSAVSYQPVCCGRGLFPVWTDRQFLLSLPLTTRRLSLSHSHHHPPLTLHP